MATKTAAPNVTTGSVVRATWANQQYAHNLTLEIQHDDGSWTFIVVPIHRMTERISAAEIAKSKKDA